MKRIQLMLVLVLLIAHAGQSLAKEAVKGLPLIQTEQQLQTFLEEILQEESLFSDNSKIRRVSADAAISRSISNNLSVKRNKLKQTLALQGIKASLAGFDSLFSMSLGLSNTQRKTRMETVHRKQSATTVNEEGDHVLEVDAAIDPRNPIIFYADPRTAGNGEDSLLVANQNPISGDENRLTLDAKIVKPLSWGGQASLSFSSIKQDTYFINNPNIFTNNPNPPLELVGFGSYKKPWVSELQASMQMPVPGTRGFGKNAIKALNTQSNTIQQDLASTELRKQLDNAIQETDSLYWNLVEAALTLQAAKKNLDIAKSLEDNTQRLYERRSVSNYDLIQAKLSTERTAQALINRLSAYRQASKNLQVHLDLPSNTIMIPDDFSDVLNEAESEKTPEKISEETIHQHTAVKSQQLNLDLADLEKQAAMTNTRLDLTLNAQLSWRQSNAVYGYDSLGDSISAVFSPDVMSKTVGLSYQYRQGKRLSKAQVRQRIAKRAQKALLLQSAVRQQYGDIDTAKALLSANKSRQGLLAKAYVIAEKAYARAINLQKSKGIREFELAAQLSKLLAVRQSVISAKIAIKRAQTSLLAATGLLSTRYINSGMKP